MNSKKTTLAKLKKMKQAGEKIACLTAYDAAMAHWQDKAGVDVILVGDSLGMVVQGHDSTLPVSLDEMVYHTELVQRGNHQAWCVADMPFMSDADMSMALESAAQLMKTGRANMVKLEGGARVEHTVAALSDLGIPVCGHLGLLPQSAEKKGYLIVGKEQQAAQRLLNEAQALESAGAEMLVLECVPAALAERVSQQLSIPVIGIGSGANTDGQVLVVNDILGLTVGRTPSFSKNYLLEAQGSIQDAISLYIAEVKSQAFPAPEHFLA